MYKKIKNLQNSLRLVTKLSVCFFFDLDEKMIKKIIETLKVCLKMSKKVLIFGVNVKMETVVRIFIKEKL